VLVRPIPPTRSRRSEFLIPPVTVIEPRAPRRSWTASDRSEVPLGRLRTKYRVVGRESEATLVVSGFSAWLR
jgi:hypothetical protein